MNFETLVNTKGIKGTRRTVNTAGIKEATSKAAHVTKDVAVKTAQTVAGWAPATNNKVDRVEYESLTRDRELIYEVRKNRDAINNLNTMLGLPQVQASTKEEVLAAVAEMERITAELGLMEKEKPEGALTKLKSFLSKKNVEEEAEEEEEESVDFTQCEECQAVLPLNNTSSLCRKCSRAREKAAQEKVAEVSKEIEEVEQAVSTLKGPKRRLIASPDVSEYDYSEAE